MAIARVQVVFQGATNLSEDRFVNTFHFFDPQVLGTSEAYMDECAGLAANFFLESATLLPVGGLLSPFINRAFSTHTYDMTLPEGEREPRILDDTWVLPTVLNDTGLPEEVAVCLTVHGAPPVTARRRGRLFIGPLCNTAEVMDTGDNAEPARVTVTGSASITNRLVFQAISLAQNVEPTWAIRSVTPAENYVPIVGGWIDNAFDTQRRRGPDPTSRTVWSQV